MNPFPRSPLRLSAFLLLVLLLSACAATPTPTASTPIQASATPTPSWGATLVPAAQSFVDQLAIGDYATPFSRFDDTMKKAMPEAKLKETWQQLLSQAGAYQKQLGTRTTEAIQGGQAYRIVFVTCQFEKAIIDVRVVYNTQGQVSGLFFSQGQAPGPTPTASTSLLQTAQQLVDLWAKGDYTAMSARFDAAMKAAAPESRLKLMWERLVLQLGTFTERGASRSGQVQAYSAVYVTCQFEKGPIDILVLFNSDGSVAGLQYAQTQNAAGTPQPYSPPPYVKPDSFRESQVTVGSAKWALPGTLTLPTGSGPFPAVVLVHGSGPNDRDETLGPNKPFRDLAWGLASRGIAVLRYDKRTFVYGSQMSAETAETLTLKEEVTDDALQAVQLLRQTAGIDPTRIYVLGHSLGALAAPRIGQQDPALAGLVILAGPSIPMEDAILDQYTYLFNLNGTPSDAQKAELSAMATRVARVKDPALSSQIAASNLPLGIPATYWLDLRGYNPAEVARSLSMPVLVLQGGRDYQVNPAKDFEGWKTALAQKPNATLKLYPSLNHLFMAGIGPADPSEYNIPAHVAEEVIVDLAAWIK